MSYFIIERSPIPEVDTTIRPDYGLKHKPAFVTYVARLREQYPTTPLTLEDMEDEKVYLWDSGSLGQFLTAAYVANNDRRLYIEARLSIADRATTRKDHHLNLAESSEDEDFDNGDLVTDDDHDHDHESRPDSSPDCTPESIMSSPRIECTTQVDTLPSPENEQQPSCSVVVHLDISNLPTVNQEVFVRPTYRISLEASPHHLSKVVLSHACEQFRKSQKEMMLLLKAAGKGLHMRSFTAFNDERDAYFSRDRNQSCRIAKLSDLFLNRKSLKKDPQIPMVIKIDIIDLDPQLKVTALDSAEHDLHSRVYAFHRIGTGPVRATPTKRSKLRIAASGPEPEEGDQLKPLIFAHAVRYPRSLPLSGPKIGIPCREINGLLIGDTRDADDSPEEDELVLEEKYRGLDDIARRNAAVTVNMCREASLPGVPDGIPVLPTLTFLPYVGRGAQKKNAGSIHVAVTLVNDIKDSKVPVPMGVQVNVWDGMGAKEVICKALSAKLRGFYTLRSSHSGLRMLAEEGKWRWELWVLPQKVESRERVVMHRFREENLLALFLDEEMVEKGVRVLYMEAHLLGSL